MHQNQTQSPSGTPFVRLFGNQDTGFLLDLHTNRFFTLDPAEYTCVSNWLAGAGIEELKSEYPEEMKEILSLLEQGVFCSALPEGLAFGLDWDGIVERIMHRRERTVIELTRQCNLRCRYCTFGGGFPDHRRHSSLAMSGELAAKAVDSAFSHGDALDEIAIGFYGGEPLLAFGQLERTVRYAQDRAKGKRIRFSVTTNATLIDETKAAFLKDAGFHVLVSIDGPRRIHDRYRVFRDGRGSHEAAMRGLKTLVEVYGRERDKIGINMVAESLDWVPHLEGLWDEAHWLPRDIRAQVNLMDLPDGFIPDSPPCGPVGVKEEWLACVRGEGKTRTMLTRGIYDTALATVHQRPLFDGCRKTFFPNGCCIPAARKIYVRADGFYQICERVHGVPPIGSVEKGVDLKAIKHIIEEYISRSFQDCKDCWAISLCSLCFLHAYRGGGFDAEKKRSNCRTARKTLASRLETYGYIGRDYPGKLREWEEMDIS